MHSPTLAEQISQLESAITLQESLRPTLGDAAVDTVIGTLRDKLTSLRAQRQALESPSALTLPEQMLAGLMPNQLTQKMRSTSLVEGERKRVTVVFADLSGYTPLGERLDPEEVMRLSQDLLKELAEAVYQYEGYVAEFAGDAIMAVFGAPISHEDDAERALRAALAMRERIARLNRRWQDHLGQPLVLHIGINTGMVVTGAVGSDLRMSYAVVGDTVNTAQRLQSVASPGQILVSRDTYRLSSEAFNFEVLEPVTVKGKRQPLTVFELQRAKLLPSKSRGLKELGTAFVGRERELAKLSEVTDEFKTGRGRIIGIDGEAGIGKSRLLAEWHKAIEGRAFWLEGRAFAHTTSLAYSPFLDLLRRYTGIQDEHSESQARTQLDQVIERLFPNDPNAAAVLANLLAMQLSPDESSFISNLGGEELRRQVFALMAHFLERLTTERPTILIIEDLHWADQTSLDLIESLLPLAQRLPIAIVGVWRSQPDREPSHLRTLIETQFAEIFTDFPLAPLTEDLSLDMVEQLLSTPTLPDSLCTMIWTKAEGNPFFVEELIRTLIERGALVRADGAGWKTTALIDGIAVPDTLQGVLMARVDSLPEETKWVAQEAAVIGRIFLYRVLRQITEQPETLDADLNQLERGELIRQRTRLPELEYIFKHALTQEVTYASLLAPRRKELHRHVGAALETIFAERLGEFYSIIGEHFMRGEEWANALDYLNKAGDAAAHLYAYAEARVHYSHAIEAHSRLPDTEENRRRRVDLTISLVEVTASAEVYLPRLREAEELIKELQGPEGVADTDRVRLARIHLELGRAYYYRNELSDALRYYQLVLDEAPGLGHDELLATPASTIGQVLAVQGYWSRAEPLFAQAISPLEKAGYWREWNLNVGWRGVCMAQRGDIQGAFAEAERVRTQAVGHNDVMNLSASFDFFSFLSVIAGDYRRAVEESRKCVQVAEPAGDWVNAYAAHMLGSWAHSRLGEHEAARQSMLQLVEVSQHLGGQFFLAHWVAAIKAELALNAGQIQEALVLANDATTHAKQLSGIYAEGLAQQTWGRALAQLEIPETDTAESHLADSIRLLESGGAFVEAARTELAWGLVCRQKRDMRAAHTHFEKALAQFEAAGLTQELERTRSLMGAGDWALK